MLTTLGVLLGVLAATAGPASAHTVGGGGPTNFTTHLGALTPATPGLTLTVVENGSRLRLVNHTGKQVIVMDYEGFPYLRVDADGTQWDNRLSQATYLNRDRNGTTPIPSFVPSTETGAVEWEKTGSTGSTLLWHDHRIHYIATIKPPGVLAHPDRRQTVGSDYSIKLTVDGSPVQADGQLIWQPGPSSLPWWIVVVVAGLGVAMLPRLRAWRLACAGAMGVVVALDVVHSFGIAAVKQGSTGTRVSAFLVGNWVDMVAWAAGIVSAVLLARKGQATWLMPMAAAGLMIALIGGFGDVTTLSRSTAPFKWSIGTARVLTSLSIGMGLGLVLMAVLGLRRHDQPSAASAAAIQASSIDSLSDSS